MRKILLPALLCLTAAIASAQSPSPESSPAAAQLQPDPPAVVISMPYKRLEKSERVHLYLKSMFGYAAIGKAIAAAGISTATNTPEDWGPGWSGFGKRVANNMARNVIKNTAQFGLDEALKLDSRYIRTEGKSVKYRIGYAAISPFVARNEHGRMVVGLPRVAATFGATFIASQTWYPEQNGWRDGLRGGAISLGTTALFNMAKEFFHRK
jgi:hypothetical protein